MNKRISAMTPKITALDALELVRDLASQEWQSEDGKRHTAVGNDGKRFWFITDDVMQEVSAILAAHEAKKQQQDHLTQPCGVRTEPGEGSAACVQPSIEALQARREYIRATLYKESIPDDLPTDIDRRFEMIDELDREIAAKNLAHAAWKERADAGLAPTDGEQPK